MILKRPEKGFQLDPETLSLLQVIESTDDDAKRRAAIMDLAGRGGMNAARILIETFERSMWRSTKFAIIQALGRVRHERATEFLCRVSMDADDFAMAAEAVMAMGSADDPVAGEFLGSILRTPDHPLLREALTAVSILNFFPCEREISGILNSKKLDTPPSVTQNAIIAAGLRGYRKLLKPITKFLTSDPSGPLFNTSLITLGRLGDDSTLTLLENLDTRYRAFAHQLKMSAVDHLRLKLSYTIEDAVGAAIDATSPAAIRQAWQVLGSFPEESAREALSLLAADTSPEFMALERALFFRPESFRADLELLAAHSDKVRPEIFASLARLHATSTSATEVLKDLTILGDSFKIKFLSLVRVDGACEELCDMASKSSSSQPMRLAAINAIIPQALMHGGSTEIRDSLGKRFAKMAESESDPAVANRMIRAIGQLRYLGPDASNLLRDILKDGGNRTEAVYATLAACDTPESFRMISKRLRQIISVPEQEAETRGAILSLARGTATGDATCLANLPQKLLGDSRVAVLKILCGSPVPDMAPFVAKCLLEKDYQTRLLAAVAAKTHHSPEILACMFEFLDHDNPSLAGRALDTLVTGWGAAEHLRLLERMAKRPDDEGLYRKVLRSLTRNPGDSYNGVIAKLESLITSKKGVMADQDMIQAAVNLRDNLAVAAADDARSTDNSKGKLTEKERHEIDETLNRSLRGFPKYSETIKSVLRSGEVTWQHPELFDARVDKSTVLVQYVKSIDLLMQEKIGSQIFLAQGADFLQKLQSRVTRLELDDDAGFDSSLVTTLDCSMYFSRDSFPAHKLGLICRSVMTGLIMKEQYRVVDGLRAWALLLLLFGRTFKFRGQIMEPLLPLIKTDNDGICRIAKGMNELQDARNRAAHRGTILEMGNMQEMRDLCASLLNDLDGHLLGGK